MEIHEFVEMFTRMVSADGHKGDGVLGLQYLGSGILSSSEIYMAACLCKQPALPTTRNNQKITYIRQYPWIVT